MNNEKCKNIGLGKSHLSSGEFIMKNKDPRPDPHEIYFLVNYGATGPVMDDRIIRPWAILSVALPFQRGSG